MKSFNSASKGFLVVSAAFLSFLPLNAQTSDCKVLVPEISGKYVGDCKNGLAHGKGTATGTDSYEGQFSKGLPNGKGTYTWSTGLVYKGEWSKGFKEGEGEMVYHTMKGDSIVKGFWRANKYLGEKKIPEYIVIRKDDLLSYNFRRVGEGNDIIIKCMMKGQINTKVRGMTLVFTSGTQFKTGNFDGVQSVNFPVDLKINYTTNNPISRASFDVVFECTINTPGRWEIILNN
jgi:hypothetical protein